MYRPPKVWPTEESMITFVSPVATEFVPSKASRTRFMDRMIRSAFGLVVGAALLVAAGSTPAHAQFAGPAPLTLINGWVNAPFSTSNAAAKLVNGIVHFKGAIATSGTNTQPFVLPTTMRPLTDVYVPLDLCNSTVGRLHIQPTGTVLVEAAVFSNAQCFTSLDGAWYARRPTGFKLLTLINGWTNAPFVTSNAEAANVYGLVYFKGAIATSGTNSQPFTLPVSLRPVTNVYVPIDLCNATKGRLIIQTNGAVNVQAEGAFSNAQCFTSLDGASFVQYKRFHTT